MRLGICMIVRDEEANLARCLSQVTDIADEIVIADTGSVDRTKEIAAGFTGKIYDFAWIDDFSAARNFSFGKSSADYIMWLDADDYISEENQKKLRRLKDELPPDRKGVYAAYAHTENGALISSFPRLRIVKRGAGFKWRDRIHETLMSPSVRPREYFHSDVVISQEIKPRGTTARYLAILGNIIESGNDEPRMLQLYASELEKHGRDGEAVRYFERYFNEGGLEDPECLAACMQLGSLYERAGEYEKAIEIYRACMPRCGNFSEYCCALGNFYFEAAKDPDEAVFWYRAALGCPRPQNAFVLERFYHYVPHFRLYQIFDACGDKETANAHLARAVDEMRRLESGK